MPSALRSLAAFAFVSAIAVLSAPGCSQQGEAERCDSEANGNADCDDGLVCVSKNKLQEPITDLCCHSDPANDSSSRCLRKVPSNTGGSGGSGGSNAGSSTGGASAGAAGEAAGGTPGASGSPTTTDGGMSGAGGAPVTIEGGAAGAGTAGQGGAG